jgi:hypothetical protein
MRITSRRNSRRRFQSSRDLASEALAQAKKYLQDEIDESVAKVKAAEEVAAVKVAKMRSFDAVFGSSYDK